MTKIAIIGAGPCGLSMLRSFEQAEKKGEKPKAPPWATMFSFGLFHSPESKVISYEPKG